MESTHHKRTDLPDQKIIWKDQMNKIYEIFQDLREEEARNCELHQLINKLQIEMRNFETWHDRAKDTLHIIQEMVFDTQDRKQ